MSQSSTAFNGQFVRRSNKHRITIAKGTQSKSFTVRPWVAASLGFLTILISFGYFGATGYLVFRDQWLDQSAQEKKTIRAAYESRIDALKTRIDQVSSSRAVQTELMAQRLHELQKMRNEIAARSAQLASMLTLAKSYGLQVNQMAVPTPKPERGAVSTTPVRIDEQDQAALMAPLAAPKMASIGYQPVSAQMGVADLNQAMRREISDTLAMLKQYAANQEQALVIVELVAEKEAKGLGKVLKLAGVKSRIKPDASAQGGPFIPLGQGNSESFSTQIDSTMRALAYYKAMKQTVQELPLARPLTTFSHRVSSGFGPRRDPFHRRRAFHSGMDFKAPTGTPVRATGAGKITKVGRQGGYGLTVEVHHGNGIVTRYAHLSRTLVKRGQKVVAGQAIGRVGSTGRSTGPHLHYEVRVDNRAVNPARFLRAGDELRQTL